jgi:hypothetical protein
VRVSIRKVLSKGRGIFFSVPEAAEDLVYGFLKAHYDDPFMNWEESPECASLAALGFRIENLNTVIDDCYGRL